MRRRHEHEDVRTSIPDCSTFRRNRKRLICRSVYERIIRNPLFSADFTRTQNKNEKVIGIDLSLCPLSLSCCCVGNIKKGSRVKSLRTKRLTHFQLTLIADSAIHYLNLSGDSEEIPDCYRLQWFERINRYLSIKLIRLKNE